MTNERNISSRLFTTSVIEGRLDFDEKYDKAYNIILPLTRNATDFEAHDALQKAVLDKRNHDDVCLGLMVGILSDPPRAQRYFRDLTLISQDSLKVVGDALIQLVAERYFRLLDVARRQLLWIVREMAKTNISIVEGIIWVLLRHIAGGDLSSKNIWLADTLVDILREYRNFLDSFPAIVTAATYTYLRILEDHHGPQFAALRQKEVTYVVNLLREKFQDCIKIGRDLVRLLQNIARIPEIELFWRDLLHNPTTLSPNFTGILQLLQTRTSRRYFVARLTPEMEKKMVFLCTDVKFGMQKRYQEWFQRQYLNTTEAQTLRCDLIRFIIGCIHPSNEVLCSDIIPRWAVIGWLLSSCTSPIVTANSKISLFYDWLFYSETDNIMNIEPGILVMYHSLRPHPVLTASLLDFLCRVIPQFHPQLTDKVRIGVRNSLRQILDKRVVQSLEPLFDNPRMDVELRKLVRETFGEFCTSSPLMSEMKSEDFSCAVSSATVTKMDLLAETGLDFGVHSDMHMDLTSSNHVMEDDDAVFSDEDEDSKLVISSPNSCEDNPPVTPISYNRSNSTTRPEQYINAVDIKCELKAPCDSFNSVDKPGYSTHLDFLEKDMRNLLEDYALEKSSSNKCDILQKICDLIFSEDLDDTECQHLAAILTQLLAFEINTNESLLPEVVNTESIEESLNRPLNVLFDNLVTLTEDDYRRQSLLLLLVEMHNLHPSLGYHLLYFLKASSLKLERDRQQGTRPITISIYRDLCKASGQKDFAGFMLRDLQICCENDPRLISWIVPEIYQTFPKQTQGNADLVQMVIERLDSSQLHDLVCMVLQGVLQMFDNHSFSYILEKSLQWETVEQIFLWQLARAHEIPVDCCLSVLPKLKFSSHTGLVVSSHGEALSNILMMLRRESPSETLLKPLLLRELHSSDPTVATILQYWVQRYEDKMAKLIFDIINTKHHPSPNKRKRNQNSKGSSNVSLDQVLSHLSHLRTVCEQTNFFALATMQAALQAAQNQCTENQKKKYSDLLALIEEEEPVDVEPARKPKPGRGRKPKTRKKPESESEDDSSEDEDVKKPPRKRKKNQVASDSE